MTDHLDEIEARAVAATTCGVGWRPIELLEIARGVPALVAEVRRLREALRRLADAGENFASSDPDMPSASHDEAEFEAALGAARAALPPAKKPGGNDDRT